MSEPKVVEKQKVAGGIRLTGHIRINQTPETCYRYWRDLKNLPQFLKHIDSVVEIDNRRSHWTVTGPADTSVEWDAVITEDVPSRRIAWTSTGNAQVKNAGSVNFEPMGPEGGTLLAVELTYDPPLGIVGEWFSELFGGNPNDMLEHNLNLFKAAMEGGHTGPAKGVAL